MKIGIFGADSNAGRISAVMNTFDSFSGLKEVELWIESGFYDYLCKKVHYVPEIRGLIKDKNFEIDLALSIGGDGTFLRTASIIGEKEIPILGINTGRLGFLANVNPDEIPDALKDIMNGDYTIESRTMISLDTDIDPSFYSEARFGEKYNCALNEIAVVKKDTSSMLSIDTLIDGEYLNTYLADGLILSTPTGSTAYSLSVNGPIIYPGANIFVLSAIAPHSLNVRPLVIPDTCTISLKVETRSSDFLVAVDGRPYAFHSGASLEVKKSSITVRMVRRRGVTFYHTLRKKLMWGNDVRKFYDEDEQL